jgi:hypothetical protein
VPLEAVEVAGALVVREDGGVSELERGVPLHPHLFAEALARPRAVAVTDDDVRVLAVLVHQLVPGGLQCFAVLAPALFVVY